MASNDRCEEGALQKIRTHLVPLAFFAGAVGLASSSTADVLLQIETPLVGAPWGFGLAAAYVLLGGVWEWTIKMERQSEREYQRAMELLNEHDDNDI